MHVWCACNRKEFRTHLGGAIRKYGVDAFEISTLYEAINLSEAVRVERALIAQYDTISPNGYNLTSGGETASGFKRTKEAVEKGRQSNLGKKRSLEVCKKFSEIAKARPPMSAEHKAKIAAALKGRVFSVESRAKISAAKTGVRRSAESNAKLSAAKLGISRDRASVEKGRLTLSATWARKRTEIKACRNGHEFTPENTVKGRGNSRECRICVNLRAKRNYHRRQGNEAVTWH